MSLASFAVQTDGRDRSVVAIIDVCLTSDALLLILQRSDDDMPAGSRPYGQGDDSHRLKPQASISPSFLNIHTNPFGLGPSQDTLQAPLARQAQPPAGISKSILDDDDYGQSDVYDVHGNVVGGSSSQKERPRVTASSSYAYGGHGQKGDKDEDLDELDQIDALSWDYAAQASPYLGSHVPKTYEPQTSFMSRMKNLKPPLPVPAGGFSLADLNPFGGKGGEGQTRTIYLNDSVKNGNGKGGVKGTENEGKKKWRGNEVGTGKYNIVTFLPKFLFEQFSKYANLFFLFTACIQQIPNVSPTNRWTTIVPLAIVIAASALKELQEDIKRHSSDRQLNASTTKVLNPLTSGFEPKSWRKLKVGDLVRLENNELIPADCVLLASGEPEGLTYVETSNLDGETNLKIKQANSKTSHLISPNQLSRVTGALESEAPNSSLYTYDGTLRFSEPGNSNQTIVPIGPDQVLLRGAQIRNTEWCFGLVVAGGHETKLFKNTTAAPIKRTAVEKQVNQHIIFLFIVLLVLALISTIGSSIRKWFFSQDAWYLRMEAETKNKPTQFVEDFLTCIILYNNLIPISLIVSMDVVKFQLAQFINTDLDMYYAKTDTPAVCRTSSLVEELGQIGYIFSDKTGTLTCNEMEFRECSIGGVMYAQTVDETKEEQGQKNFTELERRAAEPGPEGDIIREFLTLLAVCHTVIPENKDGKIIYQASSPDEAALVSGAEQLGYRFHVSI